MHTNMDSVLKAVPAYAAHHQDADLLSSLPLELLDSIVAHLDLHSLAHLACTCRYFSVYPLVVQHPDYAFLQSLACKDLAQFRTLVVQNKYRELSQGLVSIGASLPRRLPIVKACYWILVAQLNEPSPQFWNPLSHLVCANTSFLEDEFVGRLAPIAIERHHAAGLTAFSNWIRDSTERRLESPSATDILLSLSDPASTTAATVPTHVKADIQLALFPLVRTSCSSHSQHDSLDPTCALDLLAATQDLGVIIHGLLHLEKHHEHQEKLFWFKHSVSPHGEAIPAIHHLLAALLHRGRYNLFKDMMDNWMLVLAGGSKQRARARFAAFGNDEDEDDSGGDSDSDTDWELEAWIRTCNLNWVKFPMIQLGGTPVFDYRHDVVARLAVFGVSGEQANGILQLFKRYVFPLDLTWILDVDFFWSVPSVLDGWVKWLLTHMHLSVANVCTIGRSFTEMVPHLSHGTIILLLERVPIHSVFMNLDSPPTFNPESPPPTQSLDPCVFPYSLSPAVALAHTAKLQSALDTGAPHALTQVTMDEPAYWKSALPILIRKCPEQLGAICKYTLSCLQNPDVVPVNSIPFATILDAMVHGGQLKDALAALRETKELGLGVADESIWFLTRDQCAFLYAGGVGRPTGMKELLAFAWENKLVAEPESAAFLSLLNELGLLQ